MRARRGVTTGCTRGNEAHVVGALVETRAHESSRTRKAEREILFDPQTSGGLLLAVPPAHAALLLEALRLAGHRAAAIGAVVEGPIRIEVS